MSATARVSGTFLTLAIWVALAAILSACGPTEADVARCRSRLPADYPGWSEVAHATERGVYQDSVLFLVKSPPPAEFYTQVAYNADPNAYQPTSPDFWSRPTREREAFIAAFLQKHSGESPLVAIRLSPNEGDISTIAIFPLTAWSVDWRRSRWGQEVWRLDTQENRPVWTHVSTTWVQ